LALFWLSQTSTTGFGASHVSVIFNQPGGGCCRAELVVTLRGPTFTLSAGTVEAASEHVLMLLPHLRLLHQQRLAVAARIERLLDELSITEESQPRSDVTVVLALPGVGRIVTATLLAEAAHLLAEQTTMHFELTPASRLLHDKVENEALCSCAMAVTFASATRFTTGHASACNTIRTVATTIAGFAPKATPTAALCVV